MSNEHYKKFQEIALKSGRLDNLAMRLVYKEKYEGKEFRVVTDGKEYFIEVPEVSGVQHGPFKDIWQAKQAAKDIIDDTAGLSAPNKSASLGLVSDEKAGEEYIDMGSPADEGNAAAKKEANARKAIDKLQDALSKVLGADATSPVSLRSLANDIKNHIDEIKNEAGIK